MSVEKFLLIESVSVVDNTKIAEVHVGENCNATQNAHFCRHDDIEYVCSENNGFDFKPLSIVKKRQLCESFGICCSFVDNSKDVTAEILNMGTPVGVKDIDQDGNCLFKAISFTLTEVQDFHEVIRSGVCHHLLQNQLLFKPFLRHEEDSVENHISNSQMIENGKWATEIEILGLSHLLKTDIYTHLDNRWVLFSGRMVDPDFDIDQLGSIYLHHKDQNHYDVVTMVSSRSTNLQHQSVAPSGEGMIEYEKRLGNRERMRMKRNIFSKMQSEDVLAKKKMRYMNDETFRSKIIETSKGRYMSDENYRKNLIQKGVNKYAMDAEHRMTMKRKSIAKYKTDGVHKEKVKRLSTEKYRSDEIHRQNESHRQDLKSRSKIKYKLDEEHREKVKIASKESYHTSSEAKKDKKRKCFKEKTRTDRKAERRRRSSEFV